MASLPNAPTRYHRAIEAEFFSGLLEQVQSICSVLSTIISAVATSPNRGDVAESRNIPNMPSIRRRHHNEEHRTQNATFGLNLL
jgi:hypothetical protein